MTNTIRELRQRRHMTQAELAKAAKVAVRTVQAAEGGLRLTLRTKRRLLEALGRSYAMDAKWVFPDDNIVSLIVQATKDRVDSLNTNDPESMADLGKQVALAMRHELIVKQLQVAYPGEEHILNEGRLSELDLETQDRDRYRDGLE